MILFVQDDFNWKSYSFIFLFLAALITFNYSIDFEDSFLDVNSTPVEGWIKYFLFYLVVYVISMLLMNKNQNVSTALQRPSFYFFLVLSIGFITAEINFNLYHFFSSEPISSNRYFNHKMRLRISESLFFASELILFGLLIGKARFKLFGLGAMPKHLKTYLYFLLFMLPLIIWASQQNDFLESYPQLRIKYFTLQEYPGYFKKYEAFYLLNFIRTEWIFRGFMVLFFIKFFDKRSVILIAMIYCIFHFGKPMAECISSFFGAYFLGALAYQSKSIWGGVLLHMGIALLMDVTALITHLSF